MTVAYKVTDSELIGASPLTAQDTTQALPLGTILCGTDPTYGVGEFEYVKFTGAVTAGDFVVIDRWAKTCIQSPTSATKGNFGIAMATQASGQYGFVMLRGIHDGANVVTGVAAGALLGQSAVAGRANVAGTVANATLDGALVKVTAASNLATVELYWPTVSGR